MMPNQSDMLRTAYDSKMTLGHQTDESLFATTSKNINGNSLPSKPRRGQIFRQQAKKNESTERIVKAESTIEERQVQATELAKSVGLKPTNE
jgi:hypothetical protein